MAWFSALMSLAGTAASGIGSAIANRKEKEQIEKERGEMNRWYNQQIYQDPTQRADFVGMLNELDRKIRKSNQTAEAKGIITGETPEAAAARAEANANAMAEVIAQQSRDNAKRIDLLNADKRKENVDYNRQQADLRAKQYESWGNLAANAANSFGGFEKGDLGEVDTTTAEKAPKKAKKKEYVNPDQYVGDQVEETYGYQNPNDYDYGMA